MKHQFRIVFAILVGLLLMTGVTSLLRVTADGTELLNPDETKSRSSMQLTYGRDCRERERHRYQWHLCLCGRRSAIYCL